MKDNWGLYAVYQSEHYSSNYLHLPQYAVDGCQKDCLLYISQNISCDNVSEYLIHAHTYSNSLLKEKTFKYITTSVSYLFLDHLDNGNDCETAMFGLNLTE